MTWIADIPNNHPHERSLNFVDQPEKKIGYLSMVAIGIGGMVGGGIFAILGLLGPVPIRPN
jgi:amino acid transporter